MNSVPQISMPSRTLSIGDYSDRPFEKINFVTPTCRHLSTVKIAARKKARLSRKRLSFSPNINSFAMQSPDCSPILGENCGLNISLISPCKFSPRAKNQVVAENSFQNLSFLNKTISMENLLKAKKMERYVDVFRKEEIDNLAVFTSLTERDLVEIGIKNKKDRGIILEIIAEYQGEI